MTQDSVALQEVRRFTDQQLIARLRGLVRADQALGARLLVHLGEVDARGLYREQAYSSMFAYCVEELHMSEAEAYLRIHAARLGRQFPLVVQLFERGALHLSTIKRLGPHLTSDNHVQLLERASGKGKREIELLVAALAPKPDVPSRMRKLPEMSRAPGSRGRAAVAPLAAHPAASVLDVSTAAPHVVESKAGQSPCAPEGFPAAPAVGTSGISFALEAPRPRASSRLTAHPPSSVLDGSIAAPPVLESQASQAPLAMEGFIAAPTVRARAASFALEAPRPRASCVPLSPGRYKVTFTAGRRLHDKLEQLQDLLRHRVPDGDLGVIVELAVGLLFDKTMKQRFAQTHAPKKSRSIQRGDVGEGAEELKVDLAGTTHADERARAAARVRPLAARASGSPGARSRQVNSRYIPRAVVREVYERDGGRCTFVSSDGKRCSARGFLELHHHDVPYGRDGKATVDNMRLACRAHNALFAERDYGTRFMHFKQLHGRARTRTESTRAGTSPSLILSSLCACPKRTT